MMKEWAITRSVVVPRAARKWDLIAAARRGTLVADAGSSPRGRGCPPGRGSGERWPSHLDEASRGSQPGFRAATLSSGPKSGPSTPQRVGEGLEVRAAEALRDARRSRPPALDGEQRGHRRELEGRGQRIGVGLEADGQLESRASPPARAPKLGVVLQDRHDGRQGCGGDGCGPRRAAPRVWSCSPGGRSGRAPGRATRPREAAARRPRVGERRASGNAPAVRGTLRPPRSRRATRCGMTPAAWPRSSRVCTARRPALAAVEGHLVDPHPDEAVGDAASPSRARSSWRTRGPAAGGRGSSARVSRTRRVRRAISSGPRSRRTALPPRGSGRPVSAFHQAPRSSTLWRPWPPKVSWPSWMMRPTSARPARTSSRIRSKGTTRVSTPGAKSWSAR